MEVTFLFTKIAGSTELLQSLDDRRYGEVLAGHQRLLRAAFEAEGGQEVDTQGDAFFVVFPRASGAVAAAASAQRVIASHPWPEGAPVRVQMGLHTGEATIAAGGYVGLESRTCSAGSRSFSCCIPISPPTSPRSGPWTPFPTTSPIC